ncbi:MAG: Proline dehydrogenase [uncultured Thermomicrobiales bacterium]|uniref:proline dehydrogenase n=1 Tax=uncultured Thermomicrobiales bacterium TaxID=1645740 RepID=A0A6J4U834_9BACT|nr:MAG: Proline dehydrogenase [uncultured Thermomicrobiales bacterium]
MAIPLRLPRQIPVQQLLRRPLLALAESDQVEGLMRRNGFSKGLVARFVAGEDLETALGQVRALADQGMTSTLDQLGENVASEEEARQAVGSYTAILDRIAEANLEPNISVKLTMLGLDLGDPVAMANLAPILERAEAVGGFVRVDMEGSTYTERTMAIVEAMHDRFPGRVGTVIQSYLRRAEADVERMIARNARVRLVKGAYAEPATVAFQDRREVDANYARLMTRLLDAGTYPAIATHDPALIAQARDHAARQGIASDRWEFQMLYGVRRDEQVALTKAGYRMRIYVPFGTEWYPYFTRRIAERPANALFVARQLVSG